MGKSVLRVAGDALATGEAAPAPYASRYSRRDHTRPQLFALPMVRQLLKIKHRGVVALATEWRELREALGLARCPLLDAGARGAPSPRRGRIGAPSVAPRPR